MSSLRLFVHTWRSLRRVPVYRTTIVLTLAGAAATSVAFAVLASWIPARRAAQVDLTESLRAD